MFGQGHFPVVTILSHVMRNICSSMVSLVLLCNGLLCHRVGGILFCCVDIMVCCVVHPCLGLNYIQYLGAEDTYNALDKPSVEPHNKIRVAGESAMHILKSIGREGVS